VNGTGTMEPKKINEMLLKITHEMDKKGYYHDSLEDIDGYSQLIAALENKN